LLRSLLLGLALGIDFTSRGGEPYAARTALTASRPTSCCCAGRGVRIYSRHQWTRQ
jgi:hypothetical protein